MPKKIIFIILISVLLSACSIAEPKVDRQNKGAELNNNQQVDKPVDLGLLAKTYQMKLKVILNNYLRQTQDKSLITVDDVSQTKNLLLVLKMPAQFKDLHFDLVLALEKMEDYLIDGDEEKLRESEELIKQAKEEYEWLN